MLSNWPYTTPCQKRPELFDARRGGEEYEEFVSRIDIARTVCDTQCKKTRECAEHATLVEVTGVCAGSLYEEGVRKELPRPVALRMLDRVPKRKSMCCRECETEYMANNGNPLCRECRRSKVAYFTGESAGEAGGSENPPSRVRRPANCEAA